MSRNELRKQEFFRKKLLDEACKELYVAVPHITWDSHQIVWEIALPGESGESRKIVLVRNNTPLQFSDQQVAEDFTAALNIGRSQRHVSEP